MNASVSVVGNTVVAGLHLRLGRIVLLGAVLAAGPALADDVMRCGGVLVMVGMIGPEVAAKCGPPKDRSVTEIPQRARRANGRSAMVGTLHVERWTYDRGYGQFPALLTFEDGKLKSIELLTGSR